VWLRIYDDLRGAGGRAAPRAYRGHGRDRGLEDASDIGACLLMGASRGAFIRADFCDRFTHIVGTMLSETIAERCDERPARAGAHESGRLLGYFAHGRLS